MLYGTDVHPLPVCDVAAEAQPFSLAFKRAALFSATTTHAPAQSVTSTFVGCFCPCSHIQQWEKLSVELKKVQVIDL